MHTHPTPLAPLLQNLRASKQVIVREVGLRDGLQSITTIMPTAQNLDWISAAYAEGQREIEAGSFVPSRLLPQFADTDELVEHARTLTVLVASVLVPNLKGAQRAIEVGADATTDTKSTFIN